VNKKLNRTLKHILYVFMIFCIVPDSINAKDIFSIDINPLNRAIIHFDTIPLKYSSNLSDDKKRIYINVGNYTFKDNIKQKSGLGIINDIYLTKSDSGTVVNIRTKEKRGYTIVNYPFSSRLAVEVFSWENLTKEEEAYRTALLAFEDGIYTEALREFYFLSKKNYIPSVYFLGMIYLKSKNFSQAATAFRFVIQNDSNNIDALAGYSLAAMNLGENNYQQYQDQHHPDQDDVQVVSRKTATGFSTCSRSASCRSSSSFRTFFCLSLDISQNIHNLLVTEIGEGSHLTLFILFKNLNTVFVTTGYNFCRVSDPAFNPVD